MHRIADKVCSRKPVYSRSNPYALGPGLRGDSASDCKLRLHTLLHVWIDIHSPS
jgi:hypothetical protein